MREVSSPAHGAVTCSSHTEFGSKRTNQTEDAVTPPMRWLALLATGGAVAGGAAALSHVPTAAGAVSKNPTATPVRSTTSTTSTKDAAEIRMLIAETNSLQSALSSAREQLVRIMSHPGGRTEIIKTITITNTRTRTVAVPVAGRPSAATLAQLTSEQAALVKERSQLQAEAAQLGGQARTLTQRQAQLVTEQARLVKEAAALAAQAKKLAKPATHGKTGASSGASSGGHDD